MFKTEIERCEFMLASLKETRDKLISDLAAVDGVTDMYSKMLVKEIRACSGNSTESIINTSSSRRNISLEIVWFLKTTHRLLSIPEIEKALNANYISQTLTYNVSKGHLVRYKREGNKSLYGLPEWFNEDGTPKPEYIP